MSILAMFSLVCRVSRLMQKKTVCFMVFVQRCFQEVSWRLRSKGCIMSFERIVKP